jgi:hypothetical protein
MSSRTRILSLIAFVALAMPAAALWVRVTQFFFADFDLKSGPGQQLPLAAEKGTIVGAAPVFTVVPQPQGGGALLITGAGAGAPPAAMDALFDKVFSGSELQIGWTMVPGAQAPGYQCNVELRCMEDNDGEIIDVGWGGGGVDVGGTPVAPLEAGQSYTCTLTLRDNLVGPDTWIFSIAKQGGVPLTSTGLLALSHPLTLTKLQLALPAGATGTTLVDDLQASSASFASSK